MGLSLEKKSELVRLNLEKRQVPTGIKIAVKQVIDVSGSIKHYFNDGTMQELTDRLLPVAMRFDDNQSLETYAFGSDIAKLDDVVVSDFGNYIDRKFLRQVPNSVLWTGTKYAKALQMVYDDINPKRTFGSFFGKKPEIKPSFVEFITDGDTQGDEYETERVLEKLGNFKCYVQLIGVGRGSSFRFLRDMADQFGHVGFVTFPDLDRVSDEDMYAQLLGEELCSWIKVQ